MAESRETHTGCACPEEQPSKEAYGFLGGLVSQAERGRSRRTGQVIGRVYPLKVVLQDSGCEP